MLNHLGTQFCSFHSQSHCQKVRKSFFTIFTDQPQICQIQSGKNLNPKFKNSHLPTESREMVLQSPAKHKRRDSLSMDFNHMSFKQSSVRKQSMSDCSCCFISTAGRDLFPTSFILSNNSHPQATLNLQPDRMYEWRKAE